MMTDLQDCSQCESDNIILEQKTYVAGDYFVYECADCGHTGSRWSSVKGARVCWNAENKKRGNIYVESVLNSISE